MKSELAGIISRLVAMQDGNGEIKTRHFEKNGEDLAKVTYDEDNQIFQIDELKNGESYKFDNIDLVAIEIYDILGA
ncbi:MAG: YkuJ family protein [Lactobacillaceae bacterium]